MTVGKVREAMAMPPRMPGGQHPAIEWPEPALRAPAAPAIPTDDPAGANFKIVEPPRG